MKDFSRSDLSFSLCGLNCALCTMQLGGHYPGCGSGSGNQSCSIAKCSLDQGGYGYCVECEEYPCAKYENITEYDSFVTHRNQLSDMKRFRKMGACVYHAELSDKVKKPGRSTSRTAGNTAVTAAPFGRWNCPES